MRTKLIRIFSLLLFMFFSFTGCKSKTNKNQTVQQIDRQPAVAGKFYPGEKSVLEDTLKAMFNRAVANKIDKPVLAIIAPHAGYVFSGDVAASSYNQVKKKHYKDIFVVGSSHYALYKGAAIYASGDFITPLGKVKVDINLAKSLIKNYPCFVENNSAHSPEHSIEVQLPFLQYIFGDDINLVPILLEHKTKANAGRLPKR